MQGEPGNRLRLVAAPLLFFLALAIGRAQVMPGFLVSATLRNGSIVTGTLPADGVDPLAVSATGEVVRVPIQKPPEWSALKVVCEIEWRPARKVFVVREIPWTGELARLWDRLQLLGEDGSPVTVRGEDVKSIRFVYGDAVRKTLPQSHR